MLYFTVRTFIELYPNVIPMDFLDPKLFHSTIKDAILDECGDLPCIYRNGEQFKREVCKWFKRNRYRWEKLVETMHYEYDPIANYDRKETVTDKSTIKSSGTNNSENNSVERVSAFNSDSMTDKQSGTFNGTTIGNMDVEKTDARTVEIKGNIGVMTTQDMIKQQREILQFNIQDVIAREFKTRFCVLLY